MSFWTKFKQATQLHNSYVCIGLDSDKTRIPKILKSEKNPIWQFNKEIIDATKNKVAAYKMNYAFYVSAGNKGIDALYRTLGHIPNYIPKIIDAKVGDIANTMTHYAKGFFEELSADALTVNPLMGSDVFKPFKSFKENMIFVLTLTSNASASEILGKNNLYKEIAKKLSKMSYQNVGAVVGATNGKELKEIRELMPKTVFLIPGIGAQGGDLNNVIQNGICSKKDPRILINSSRGIIFAGDSEDFANDALNATEKLRSEINNALDLY